MKRPFFLSENDPCQPNPCQHGGLCDSRSGESTYQCKCPDGFSGVNCDSKHYHIYVKFSVGPALVEDLKYRIVNYVIAAKVVKICYTK